jgi:hypothetical protein
MSTYFTNPNKWNRILLLYPFTNMWWICSYTCALKEVTVALGQLHLVFVEQLTPKGPRGVFLQNRSRSAISSSRSPIEFFFTFLHFQPSDLALDY